MKLINNFFIALCLTFGCINLYGQQEEINTISVVGYAEEAIVPTEIYFSIALQEYVDEEQRVEMKSIENTLIEVAKKYGISLNEIEIHDFNGYQSYDSYSPRTVFTKTFRLKTDKILNVEGIMKEMDDRSLSSVTLGQMAVPKEAIKKLQSSLKSEALKNARSEANDILSELGKEIVDVVNVSITPAHDYYSYSDAYMTPKSGRDKIEARYVVISSSVNVTFSYR